jgi:transcriptional regulator with XRE-family HTH domain
VRISPSIEATERKVMDELESLGKYLKKERELRNISLRDVSRNTRVREQFIQALEEDRLDLLPPPTIVKGFLQSYAKYVGLDMNAVLLRFQALLKGGQASPPAAPPRKAFPIKKTWWAAGGAAVVFLALILIIFALFDSKAPPTETEEPLATGEEAPVAKTEAPGPREQLPEAKDGAATVPAPVPSPGPGNKLLTLGLKAVERTWLHIQSSEKADMDVILQPGENLSIQDNQRIELLVGNAGGLDLIFNGTALEKFGKSGEVVTLIFTPQGVESKPHEKPKPPE